MKVFLRTLVKATARLLVWFFYRQKVVGAEHVPEKGAFLLVSNHVSFVDAIVLQAAARRQLRFLMLHRFYERGLVGWFCRLWEAIPIEPSDGGGGVRQSLDVVIKALKAGDAVCVFPEGAMTRTGHVHGFKRGFEVVARKAGAPIVPAYIDGLWGSVFSYEGGRFGGWPKSFRRHVSVTFGRPLSPKASCTEVRRAVLELGSDAYDRRKAHQKPLHVNFWRAARRMGGRFCMADSTGTTVSWRRAQAVVLAISRWMRRRCADEEMVGMMMPASVGAALINIAALCCGRTPVNLNFTSSKSAMAEAISRCGLRTIFTSRRFLDRIGMEPRREFVYLEDVMRSLSRRRMVGSMLTAILLPTFVAERLLLHRGDMDDLATVMFTSGSTGKPKGVMLSHHNVVSNIEAMADVFQFDERDMVMGVLPPFHAFGFTTTVWLPLSCGVPVVYHPNPLDAKGVGDMAEKYGATILIGTPSFFTIYTRGCSSERFRSLRLAVAGGQKLMPSVAEAFEKHFGLPIQEGYGCTELTPVVSVNIDDAETEGVRQEASRVGSVGRPLPGLSVRLIDRETQELLPDDSTGIVMIRGPSVMRAYLDDPAATSEVLRDGWYVTGDLGSVDEDGFLYIHDRISRFSKIGGEMIPHTAVEDALSRAAEPLENNFAVLSAPDRVRGERLAVLYDGPERDPATLVEKLSRTGVPNLWIPSPRDFPAASLIWWMRGAWPSKRAFFQSVEPDSSMGVRMRAPSFSQGLTRVRTIWIIRVLSRLWGMYALMRQ